MGLPSHICAKAEAELPGCDIFRTNATLRAFFSPRESLCYWANDLSDAVSCAERVQLLLGFLSTASQPIVYGEKWFEGLNGLQVFMTELYLHYQAINPDLVTAPWEVRQLFKTLQEMGIIVDCGTFMQLESEDGPTVIFCKYCRTPYTVLPNPAVCVGRCGGAIV